VAFHSKGGVTLSDGSDVPDPRKRNTSPPGLANAWRVRRTRDSMRTARIVTRSCASWRSGRASSSSNLAVTTSASFRPRVRTASRKNTDFRVFASTMRRRARGTASTKGIAGEPPPLPTSSIRATCAGTYRAATIGSISRRSTASGDTSDSFKPVRLIFAFQVASRR